ncbi:flagellin [Psychromonas sp. MME2]|uniref:flagellin N-terminal helical domain-containing protein n=1 Tax=unclassified Psychromonas TaxID=2614957 RepID=UPI00339BB100
MVVATVNTNVMSLNAQRQLSKSQATSNQAMERLSSGLRINSAKDDAAGLAISTGIQSQVKGINQAVRNANDGVSMAQTAEGAMDEMTNILQRMRELSVQSANDTNSASNRKAIQEEVDQLHSELDRIAETTEFNGTKLLNGSAGETTLQIGANIGQTLSFSIASVSTNSLGLNGNLNKGDLNGGRVQLATTGVDGDLKINGTNIPKSDSASAIDIAKAINSKVADTAVLASAYNVIQGDDANLPVTGITTALQIRVGTAAVVTLGATSSMENLVETINRDVAGISAALGDKGELLLTNDTGADITIGGGQSVATGLIDRTYSGYLALHSLDDNSIAVSGAQTLNAGFLESNGIDSIVGKWMTTASFDIMANDKLQINGVDIAPAAIASPTQLEAYINSYSELTGVTLSAVGFPKMVYAAEYGIGVEITSNATTQTDRGLALRKLGMPTEMGGKSIDALGVNIKTAAHASKSIDLIDKALGKISDSRASLGAIQNRLGSTVANLENVSQNLAAANSRIQDADFAAETSKMSKAQILQQAGTSMLSQANASAQSVLSMLG